MDFWVRGVLGWALMVAAVAGFAWCTIDLISTGTPWLIAGDIASVFAFLLGGWLFATRGREATQPGLPEDTPLANPRPFGN